MKTKFLIPLIAVAALLYACKGKGGAGYEVVNNSSSADSVKSETPGSSQPKLIKTAGINFKVKNVQQTVTRVITLTESMGGMIAHQQVGSTPERTQDVRISKDSIMRITSLSTTAEITVKVPAVKLEKFIDSVASMGIYVTDRNVDITDKSLDYLSAQLKLRSRAELVSQQKRGKVVIKDPAKVLDLKDDMIDQQISNQQIDNAVKYSTVNLNFNQSNTINKELIANDDPSVYGLPFFKRLGMALGNACDLFLDLVIGLANIWLFILLATGIWLAVRYYRKKPVVKVG